MVVALATLGMLVGCTHAVEDATEQLADELRAFDIVTGGYASSGEDTLFDDPYSSIQLDVVADATAEQLDELVTYWRFGVDDLDADWRLGLTKPGGADTFEGGYDSFGVSGAFSVADLTAMVRFWESLGDETSSADVSLYDYSDSGEGSIQLELDPQPSAALQPFMLSLAERSVTLPGRFQWSVQTEIPAGSLDIAGLNVLPDQHMLDVLELVAATPETGDAGDIWFWAIDSVDRFDANLASMNVGVYLEPDGIDDPGSVSAEQLEEWGDSVLADGRVWAVLREIAGRLSRSETAVALDFYVWGEQVARIDARQCPSEGSEQIYGPLTLDLWTDWSGGVCSELR